MTVKTWLRVVGGLFLFAAAVNLALIIAAPAAFTDRLPYVVDDTVLRAFADAWLVFVLALASLGGSMVYASRDPRLGRALVVTAIVAEVFSGVIADAIWIARGHSTLIFIPFIVVHLVIIATGVVVLRKDPAEER